MSHTSKYAKFMNFICYFFIILESKIVLPVIRFSHNAKNATNAICFDFSSCEIIGKTTSKRKTSMNKKHLEYNEVSRTYNKSMKAGWFTFIELLQALITLEQTELVLCAKSTFRSIALCTVQENVF